MTNLICTMICILVGINHTLADKIHIVQRGESIESIVKNYNISKEDLTKANPGVESLFYVGLKLNITTGEKPSLKDSIPSRYESWENIVSNYDTHECLLCGRNRLSDYAAKKDNYCKALKLMRDGKTDKAVDLMEKVALNPKSFSMDSSAIYQLLYFKQFGSFDFVLDYDYSLKHGYKFHCYKNALALGRKTLASKSFLLEYRPSEKNLKKYSKKNQLQRSVITIADIHNPTLYTGLLPIHGDVLGVIKNHSSMQPSISSYERKERLSLDSLIMSSLEEYKRRVENGHTYSDKYRVSDDKILELIASNENYYYTAEKTFAINNFLPYMLCNSSSTLFNPETSSETIYQASKSKQGTSRNALLLKASSMGNSNAFADLLSIVLGMPDNNKYWNLKDYKSARAILNNLLDFNQFEKYSALLNSSINSLDDIIDELQELEKAKKAQREAERAEYEREKQRKKEEKRQRILSAIGGALQVASQTYMAVTNGNMATSSSYSPGYHSYASGGIAQQIENPQFFQNTFNQIMQTTINQAKQQEYDEYNLARQGYLQMGKDISIDEWRRLKGQAILDLKEQGVDIIAEQREDLNQMNQEFKEGIDRDRKERLKQIKNTNELKQGGSITASTTQTSTSFKNPKASISNNSGSKTSSTSTQNTSSANNSGNNGNDSHQQNKSGIQNTQSSDYIHIRNVTLYRLIDGKWSKSNLGTGELCSKASIIYVKVGNNYYKVQTPQKVTRYNNRIVVGSVAHYFN